MKMTFVSYKLGYLTSIYILHMDFTTAPQDCTLRVSGEGLRQGLTHTFPFSTHKKERSSPLIIFKNITFETILV